VGRRGKLLLLSLDRNGRDGGDIAAHLRMTGRIVAYAPGVSWSAPRRAGALGGVRLCFADVRRFGPCTPSAPEPWPPGRFTPAWGRSPSP
jgi:formamidopyrimidine-DNA glycosylase